MFPSRFIASLALVLALTHTADARPRRAPPPRFRGGPHVVIGISPWVFGYVPAPRPGWVWVDGHYNAHHVWCPGYWRPAEVRVGWTWVPGYWVGGTYVEGSWREAARDGWTWVEGDYDDDGHWVPGHWEPVPPPPPAPTAAPPASDPPPPPPPIESGDVHHDY